MSRAYGSRAHSTRKNMNVTAVWAKEHNRWMFPRDEGLERYEWRNEGQERYTCRVCSTLFWASVSLTVCSLECLRRGRS